MGFLEHLKAERSEAVATPQGGGAWPAPRSVLQPNQINNLRFEG